ncbi:hypothetical protein DFH29DRAFT_815772, partial [Suillus ampliporus]
LQRNNKAMFGEGLIATLGTTHRRQHKLLNPVISTSNMRELLPTLQLLAHKPTSILMDKLLDDGSHKEIDILPLLSRSALDGVCQGVLGYPSNTLDSVDHDEYTEALWMIRYMMRIIAPSPGCKIIHPVL